MYLKNKNLINLFFLTIVFLQGCSLEEERINGYLTKSETKLIYDSFFSLMGNNFKNGDTWVGNCPGKSDFNFDNTNVTINQKVRCPIIGEDRYGTDSYKIGNFRSEPSLIKYNQSDIPVWLIRGDLDGERGSFYLYIDVLDKGSEVNEGKILSEDRIRLIFKVYNENWSHLKKGFVSVETGEKLLNIFKINEPSTYIKEINFKDNKIDLGYYFSGFLYEEDFVRINDFNEEQFKGNNNYLLRKIVNDTINLDFLNNNLENIESKNFNCIDNPTVNLSTFQSYTIETNGLECYLDKEERKLKNYNYQLKKYGNEFIEEEFKEKMTFQFKIPFYHTTKKNFIDEIELDVSYKTKLYNYYGLDNPISFYVKFKNGDKDLLKKINLEKQKGNKRLQK